MMSAVSNTRTRKAAIAAVGAIVVTLAAAACDNLGLGGTRAASLSFGVKPAAASATSSAALGANTSGVSAILVTGGGHTVDLQSADVVFKEITLKGERVDTSDHADSEDDDSDRGESHDAKFRAGSATVSLPLEGGVITPFNGQVPVGTYNGISMDAEFVRLRGTYDGQAFDVTVPINAELEQRFNPPLVVSSSSDPINISVNVDVASWLRDANGNTIDPRLLTTDSTLRAQFRQRVRASVKAFEDQDKDADESDSDSDAGEG